MNNSPIGVFDSGIGGLTILSELKTRLPNESFIYYADTLQAPYGDKSEEDLFKINKSITSYFETQNVKCIVFACNTSCAVVYPKLNLDIPCIELIKPAAVDAVMHTKNNTVAILATTQTIQSHAYKHALKNEKRAINVIEIACPMLVPFVEKGEETSLEAEKWAKKYINQVGDADVIIHGCSHYPYFERYWKGCLPNTTFINPGVTAANQLKETLMALNLQSNNNRRSLSFYISGPEDIILQHIKTQFTSEPYQLLSKIPVQ